MKLKSGYFTLIVFVLLFGIIRSDLFAQYLNKDIFNKRRQAFIQKMDGGIAIFKGAETIERNGDVNYEFRQNSDTYYLTGCDEPGIIFFLIPDNQPEYIIFIPKQRSYSIFFDGKKPGVQEVMKTFAADTVFYIDQFEKKLSTYLSGKNKLYMRIDNDETSDKVLNVINRKWGNWPKEIINPYPLLHEMRLIKSKSEIELMQKAIDITGKAHRAVMKTVAPGKNEYEMAAIVNYIYEINGCQRWAFPAIVGSGKNSCILHYEKNNQLINNGDMMVLDIGAEYGYYSADVTRSFPVNGKFSVRQKEIYEMVLKAQKAAIEAIKPGARFRDIHDTAVNVLKKDLFKLGLITDKESKWQINVWMPHGVSHWLGMDVHDVGNRRETDGSSRILKPGMVFTVEPGLYFGENLLDLIPEVWGSRIDENDIADFIRTIKPVFEKYKNIGIRIEDDILVTENGHKILSEEILKEIDELEKLMLEESELY